MTAPHPRARVLPASPLLIACASIALTLAVAAAVGEDTPEREFEALRSGPGHSNHPVGVLPSDHVHIPDGWPLGPDGTLSCLTCHARWPRVDPAGPSLREFTFGQADPLEFCLKCHSLDPAGSAAATHWIAVGRAHVSFDREKSGRTLGSIDAFSRTCLECHDGVNATESVNPTRAGSNFADVRRNHPVGVKYRIGSHTQLRAPASLPRNVRLPNGRVSCVSCHDLYSSEPAYLTVPIEGSALCLTCHAGR